MFMTRAQAIDRATSNTDFARRVGVHYTMASRIRNGKRMPSSTTLSHIQTAFNIQGDLLKSMMAALDAGQTTFGAWVQEHLFSVNASSD